MSGLSKLANTPTLICQVLDGSPIDPAPFVDTSNAALGSLGQIFAEPSVLYKKLTPKLDPNSTTPPKKCFRLSPEKSDDSELVNKWRKAKKEGWLKMSSRDSFCPPADLSVQ
eukprot:15324822-Ditylum_brightwellii.AAC.1